MNELYKALVPNGEESCLILSLDGIFYATGFRTTAKSPVQIGRTAAWIDWRGCALIAPAAWEMQILETGLKPGCRLELYNTADGFYECIRSLIGINKAGRLWVEYDQLTLTMMQALPQAEYVDVTGNLARARLIKSAEEIRLIRNAANVAVNAMESVRDIVKPGMTELEVVAKLEYLMRKQGSSGVPFTMKALAGARSAVVSRVPENVKISEGDLLLMDLGTTVDGYSSDWARTFCVGKPTETMRELYEFVWFLERSCIDMVKPGIPVSMLTGKVAELCAKNSYGKYVKPHLGHSIGICSQEWPNIIPPQDMVLEAGMVITIEPGAYISGLGGMRIEDEVIVTETGHEIITGLQVEGLEIEL